MQTGKAGQAGEGQILRLGQDRIAYGSQEGLRENCQKRPCMSRLIAMELTFVGTCNFAGGGAPHIANKKEMESESNKKRLECRWRSRASRKRLEIGRRSFAGT